MITDIDIKNLTEKINNTLSSYTNNSNNENLSSNEILGIVMGVVVVVGVIATALTKVCTTSKEVCDSSTACCDASTACCNASTSCINAVSSCINSPACSRIMRRSGGNNTKISSIQDNLDAIQSFITLFCMLDRYEKMQESFPMDKKIMQVLGKEIEEGLFISAFDLSHLPRDAFKKAANDVIGFMIYKILKFRFDEYVKNFYGNAQNVFLLDAKEFFTKHGKQISLILSIKLNEKSDTLSIGENESSISEHENSHSNNLDATAKDLDEIKLCVKNAKRDMCKIGSKILELANTINQSEPLGSLDRGIFHDQISQLFNTEVNADDLDFKAGNSADQMTHLCNLIFGAILCCTVTDLLADIKNIDDYSEEHFLDIADSFRLELEKSASRFIKMAVDSALACLQDNSPELEEDELEGSDASTFYDCEGTDDALLEERPFDVSLDIEGSTTQKTQKILSKLRQSTDDSTFMSSEMLNNLCTFNTRGRAHTISTTDTYRRGANSRVCSKEESADSFSEIKESDTQIDLAEELIPMTAFSETVCGVDLSGRPRSNTVGCI